MTEVEQRYVIKFLHTTKFSLSEIVAEFASVDGEQASAKKAVEYWMHQVKLGRTVMER
jgi:ABC-type proline/glycine betaine transport system substrate-binding protein